jgi:ABC-2 type transport system ATP-binding protein
LIILSTHIVSDVESTAANLVVLARGRLLAQGTPETLLAPMDGKVWSVPVAPDAVAGFRQSHLVTGSIRRSDGVQLRVVSDTAPQADARPVAPALEDAYLHALQRAGAAA